MALRRVKHDLPPRKIPLLGLAAAFLFAAQMVNFPVAGGTSGHLVGGVLAAALLGPSAAVVVVTALVVAAATVLVAAVVAVLLEPLEQPTTASAMATTMAAIRRLASMRGRLGNRSGPCATVHH